MSDTLSTLVTWIIVIAFGILVISFLVYPSELGKKVMELFNLGETTNEEVVASNILDGLESLYESCKNTKSSTCICGTFNYGTLAETGYDIKVKSSGADTVLQLELETELKDRKTIEGIKLCTKSPDEDAKYMGELSLADESNPELKFDSTVMLFRDSANQFCYATKASDRDGFNNFYNKYLSCSVKDTGASTERLAMLDLGPSSLRDGFDGEVRAGSVVKQAGMAISDTTGRVSYISENLASVGIRHETRAKWFTNMYDNFDTEKDGIADDVYLISISALFRQKEDEQDHDRVRIEFYDSPVSRKLAESVGKQIEALDGKYYQGEDELQQANQQFKVNIGKVEYVTTTELSPSFNFLFYQEIGFWQNLKSKFGVDGIPPNNDNYDISDEPWKSTWAEKDKIPAIFIIFTEVSGDGANLLKDHDIIFGKAIAQGVKQ